MKTIIAVLILSIGMGCAPASHSATSSARELSKQASARVTPIEPPETVERRRIEAEAAELFQNSETQERAIELLRSFTERNPDHAFLWLRIGRYELQMGRKVRAVEAMSHAVHDVGFESNVVFPDYALLCLETGNLEELTFVSKRMLAGMRPDEGRGGSLGFRPPYRTAAELHANGFVAAARMSSTAERRLHFMRAAIIADPTCAFAHYKLGSYLVGRGKYEEGKASLFQARQMFQGDERALHCVQMALNRIPRKKESDGYL